MLLSHQRASDSEQGCSAEALSLYPQQISQISPEHHAP